MDAAVSQVAPATPVAPPEGAHDRTAVLLPTRPSTTALVIIGVVLAALLTATVPVLVIRSTLFGPDDVTRRYFSALADRDADGAWAQLARSDATTTSSGDPLLTDETLRDPGYTPPDKVSVSDVNIDGKDATAQVTYQVAGLSMTTKVILSRGGAETGPLNRWRIDNGLLALDLPLAYVEGLRVAGQALVVGQNGSLRLTAFPGAYALTLSDNPLLEIPQTMLVAGAEATFRVTPSLRSTVEQDIRARVRAWLDGCVNSTILEPPGCPFAYDPPYGVTVTNVSWKLVREPELQLQPQLDNDDGVYVTGTDGRVNVTGTDGRVQVTGRTSSVSEPTLSSTRSVSFTGTAYVLSGEIRFEPNA